ncbi:MAG: ABC transporter permease subunit [Pirellulaceae bacterium]|nr:ABC transporter permease subunit [Pirellulaceae bacterium]
MLSTNMFPGILAQSSAEFYLVKWASPFFLVGCGVLAGLILLAIFLVIAKVLSRIQPWESLSRSPAGHLVAAVLTALVAGFTVWVMNPRAFDGRESNLERGLIYLAVVMLSAIVGWAFVFCAGRKSADTLVSTLTEGASMVLGIVALIVMVIGLLSGFLFPQPMAALTSVPRLFETGTRPYVTTIPGTPSTVNLDEAPFVEVPLDIDAQLLTSLVIRSDRNITLGDAEKSTQFLEAPRRLNAGEEILWLRKDGRVPPIPLTGDRKLHVLNREVDDAQLTVIATTTPAVPEAATSLITAAIVFLTGLLILLQQAVAPRASAVALATIKNELAQPLFLVLFVLGFALIMLFEFLSFYTLGEDIKLLKECGIVVIMLLAAFQGIWSASSSISEEIEGRTALTVLSKPIQRRSFVLGKFLGIFWVVARLFVMLGVVELAAVAYKPIYEAKENSLEAPIWQDCHREMSATVPGLVLGLMQATLLSTFSVALATRLPQLANIAVCFGMYVVGHLATAIVSGANEGFPIVKFVAQLVATITPILEHFSLQAAIDSGSPIPMSLLSGTLIYSILFIMLSMLLALLLFEDRDLA